MIKKLCILLLSVCTVAPLMAQHHSKVDASFAPKKGQWQVSAVIGSSQMFDQNMNYLLPTYYNNSYGSNANFNNPVGLPDEGQNLISGKNQSGDPGIFLNLGTLNSNSLINLIGIQGKYFLTDHWDVNLMFSMNINATPSKDFVEGDYTVAELPIQDYKYMEGRVENAWNVALGSNYYFNTRNERINLYAGGVLGWQMGRIQTSYPYTGETVIDEDMSEETDEDLNYESVQLYTPNSRAGQIFGLRVGAVAGIEYSIAEGLILGFEVQPISYRYDCIQICPKGSAVYQAGHHSIGFFATPNLKIGFRF